MGRQVDVDQLVGAEDIATRLGISQQQNVHSLAKWHDDFPEPVAIIGRRRVKVWNWPDVEAWAKRTGRLAQTLGDTK